MGRTITPFSLIGWVLLTAGFVGNPCPERENGSMLQRGFANPGNTGSAANQEGDPSEFQSAAPHRAGDRAISSASSTSDPFSEWNGKWQGRFTAYDTAGNERYHLLVEQVYKPAGRNQQSAVFKNRTQAGQLETVHAVNLVRDGRLICRTRAVSPQGKPIGPMTEHVGRLVGPGHIIWHRKIGEHGFEVFNEIIDGDTYWIHGVGAKGDDLRTIEIFEGRYRRVQP